MNSGLLFVNEYLVWFTSDLALLFETYSTSTIHALPCFQKSKFLGVSSLAAHIHIKKLEVESDSTVAVNLINSSDHDLHSLAAIIGNCGCSYLIIATYAHILVKTMLWLPFWPKIAYLNRGELCSLIALLNCIAGNGRVRRMTLSRRCC